MSTPKNSEFLRKIWTDAAAQCRQKAVAVATEPRLSAEERQEAVAALEKMALECEEKAIRWAAP